jgi:ribosomal-protein-alanine N-acetyltransferase
MIHILGDNSSFVRAQLGRSSVRRHASFHLTVPAALDPSRDRRHDITVRIATSEDAVSIDHIERESASSTSWSLDQVTEEINRSLSKVHVAEERGAVVGWLSAWHIPGHELQIIQITVSPGRRRRGIATTLLCEALTVYGSSVEQTVLEVREDNHAARRLYEKIGFRVVGSVRKNYYPDGAGAVSMIK